MNFYKYLTIIFSILIMNFAFAELKTWGMPTDTQEQESPAEEGTPEEGAPEESMPENDMPEEGAPEGEDIPTETDDSEISEDQPIQFKEEYLITLGLGSTMPFGKNLSDNFSSGMNFELNLTTPFQFSGIKLSGQLKMFTLGANKSLYTDYSVTTIGINLEKPISIVNFYLGTGLAMSSGTAFYSPYDDYSMTTLYLSGKIVYDLPISGILSKIQDGKFENLKISMALGGVEIFGAPAPDGTSDLIDFGLNISYPFYF